MTPIGTLNERGGPQEIPRPDGWCLGELPPWASVVDRSLTLDHLVSVFDGREPDGIR